jgi:DNA-binding PadR family transcriptional regulator
MREYCDTHHGHWAAGRHRRHGRFGFGGRHGMGSFGDRGGEDTMRARRMLAQGDLRLIALALIAQAPRHGYEIIKLLEEKTADWYSPSPGIVYPTLTYLEEAGYVTAAVEGSKKLYTITAEGRAYLQSNRKLVDVILERLATVGERINRLRRSEREDRRSLPPLVEAALDHLRQTLVKKLDDDAEAEASLVEILAHTDAELRRRD